MYELKKNKGGVIVMSDNEAQEFGANLAALIEASQKIRKLENNFKEFKRELNMEKTLEERMDFIELSMSKIFRIVDINFENVDTRIETLERSMEKIALILKKMSKEKE